MSHPPALVMYWGFPPDPRQKGAGPSLDSPLGVGLQQSLFRWGEWAGFDQYVEFSAVGLQRSVSRGA